MKLKIFLSISTLIFITSSLFAKSEGQYSLSEWEKWRSEYDQTIVGKGGWLSLAGLYWLNQGKNTIGSGKQNTHQFPTNAPISVGTLEVLNDSVIFTTNNEDVRVDSKPLLEAELSIKNRTLVTFGNFEFYVIKREIGFAVRLINNTAKKILSFKGTRFTPFDQSWIVSAKLIQHKTPQTFKVPTVYGTTREDKSAGWLEFTIDGKVQRLQAVDYGKDSLLYVMFSDATSGDTTYGAGRYIEIEWPDKNGHTLIDFNRAYNPPCAYTNYATCPLTPRQNRLQVAIKVGELDAH